VFRRADLPDATDTVLEPFYRLHGRRTYAVYWDCYPPEQWRAEDEQRRSASARLVARTVDGVLPGQEQDERDHQVRGERTETGESRWRHATQGGWFSWELKVVPDKPQELRVTYWGGDTGGREFDVLVDGEKIVTQKLDHNRPGEFYAETYRLPQNLTHGKSRICVKFQAHPGRTAGGVFGCTVLSAE
jgi:hypothetical protein